MIPVLFILLYAAPSKVRQLQMTNILARQASFTWLTPAVPNGRIRHYVVIYRPLHIFLPCSPIDQTETKLIVPASSQRVNLESLRPFTLHQVSVHAVTVKPGPEITTTFTTEQDVPEGVPTVHNHSAVSSTENVLSWRPVPCELANGFVSNYYVELDSADPWETEVRNRTIRDTSLGFSDLLPYTRYRAKVYAGNSAGRSKVAAEHNFTTSPAANLSGTHAKPTRRIFFFSMCLCTAGASPKAFLFFVSHYVYSIPSVRINMRSSLRFYLFSAFNIPQVFRISLTSTVPVPSAELETCFLISLAEPPPPRDLIAYRLSQTNVSLSWQPPYPPYGVLERYQVRFRTIENRHSPTLLNIDQFQRSRRNSDSNRHSILVPNLLPMRLYHFSGLERPLLPVNFSEAQEMRLGYYTAAMFHPEELLELPDFVVGAGNVVGGFENPPLRDSTPYRIGLIVASSFSDEVRYGYRLSLPVVVGKTGGNAWVLVFLVPILSAVLVLLALVSIATDMICYCSK
ncbi:unnamed protein product [Ixodes hexagonus]